MRCVLSKIFIEQRWQCLGFSIGLCLVMALLTALLPKVLGDVHHIFDRLPFLRPLITALLGADPGQQISGAMSQAFLWVHPTVLTLVWAHEVIYCTRTPAGEIDRGTIDFLLGLPISRTKIFIAELVGWLMSGICILLCGYIGHLLASIYHEPDMRPPLFVTAYVMVNFFAVYLAVGGFAFLVSTVSDRRGRAMGIVFAVLLSSFLINFVAQFWDPLKDNDRPSVAATEVESASNRIQKAPTSRIFKIPGTAELVESQSDSGGTSLAMFSVMHYYRPAIIIQQQRFPRKDFILLICIATACLGVAAICLRRRRICTL